MEYEELKEVLIEVLIEKLGRNPNPDELTDALLDFLGQEAYY